MTIVFMYPPAASLATYQSWTREVDGWMDGWSRSSHRPFLRALSISLSRTVFSFPPPTTARALATCVARCPPVPGRLRRRQCGHEELNGWGSASSISPESRPPAAPQGLDRDRISPTPPEEGIEGRLAGWLAGWLAWSAHAYAYVLYTE
jgi:hypothetical protein